MVNLTLKRSPAESGAGYTHGRLFVDEGGFLCWSLEPEDRGLTSAMSEAKIKAVKVYGKTAIPKGRYEVKLRVSPKLKDKPYAKKYGGMLPAIQNVPGWTGVLIHPFNTPEESLGCIAPGVLKGDKRGRIFESTKAFYDLMDFYIMPAVKRGDKIFLTIE